MNDIFEQARAVAPHVVDHAVKSLSKATRSGDEWSAVCPFHDDGTPSFRMNATTGQFYCHGCGAKGDLIGFYQKLDGLAPAEAAALVVKLGGNGHATTAPAPRQKIESRPATDDEVQALHDRLSRENGFHSLAPYRDADGRCLFAVARHEPKKIRPWHTLLGGSWTQGQPLENGRPLLWLPALLAAPEAAIIVVEGEKDAAAARSHIKALGRSDILVTTWSGGASAWRRTDWTPLHGHRVYIMPDNDDPGRKAADGIAEMLRSHCDVFMVEPRQGAKPGEGAADLDAATFGAMTDGATPWRAIEKPLKVDIIPPRLETPASIYYRRIEDAIRKAKQALDLVSYDLNEDDTGRLFVDALGECFRYNNTDSRFMIYTGTHWTPDLWNIAARAADEIARWRQECMATANPATLRDFSQFIKRIRSAGGNRAIQYFAAADPRISTSREDYNRNPHVINTPAGVVDLRTGEISAHNPLDLHTKCTRFAPNANHKPQYFLSFLDQITCGRKDLAETLQRLAGSGCSGRSGKAIISVAYGMGSGGKSTFWGALSDVLGDYSGTADIRTFSSEQRAAGHSDDLASLADIRFLTTGENNQSAKLDEGRVKRLTGGDPMSVSHKGGRTFTMEGRFTLVIYTNAKPKISGTNSGIWRRVILLPFDFVVPDEDKDLDFREKMVQADGPYILAWAIEGARLWYSDGKIMVGETVKSATDQYKSGEDTVGHFFDDECLLGDYHQVKANALREAYEKWCKENGEHVFSGRAWKQALEEHGLKRVHTRTGKVWEGITLRESQKMESNFDETVSDLI